MNSRSRLLCASSIAISLLVPNFDAKAIVVTNLADSGAGTLRQAVTTANATNGAAITFGATLSGQTITLTSGQLVLSTNMTIDASALAGGIVISGNGSSRIFRVTAFGSVTLRSLTLTSGSVTSDSGGAILNSGQLTTIDCAFTNNVSRGGNGVTPGATFNGGGGGGGAGMGGAIFSEGNSLTVSNCIFSNNRAIGGNGGGGSGNTANSDPGGNGGGPNGGLGGAVGYAGNPGGYGGGGGGGAGSGSVGYPGGAGGFGGGGGGGGARGWSGNGGAGGLGGSYGGYGGYAAYSDAGGGGGGAGLGGAIFAKAGTVNIASCTFAANVATNGLGGYGSFGDGTGQSGQGVGGAVFSATQSIYLGGTNSFAANVASTSAPDLLAYTIATTLGATDVLADGTQARATIQGSVVPAGYPTTAWFEWGLRTSYGQVSSPVSVGSGALPVELTAAISNLTAGLTYHYRVVASNSLGVFRGADRMVWSPAIVLNGPTPQTNECHASYVDAGAAVKVQASFAAAGYLHSVTLKADGTAVAWGDISTNTSVTDLVRVGAGYGHDLAVRNNETVIAWGNNGSGQATVPAGLSNVVAVAGGDSHSLALRSDGTVVGWGLTSVPVGLANVVELAAGGLHSLALKSDSTIVGWGDNSANQCTAPPWLTNAVAISAGWAHSVALRSDGTVVAWGAPTKTNVPAGLSNVVAISAFYHHSLALKADGTVVAWGEDWEGELDTPAGLSNVVAIAAGAYHNLALKSDSTMVAWGANGSGQCDIPAGMSDLPVPLWTNDSAINVGVPATYFVTYSATNTGGQAATTTRSVVVTDTQPPVLALVGDNPSPHWVGTTFLDPGATASDICAGDLTPLIQTNISFNPNAPGTYTNSFSVTDPGGNTAQTNRIVTFVEAPLVLTLAASELISMDNVARATLNGTVNPRGYELSAWFEWGTNTGYGQRTPIVIIGATSDPVPVSQAISNLAGKATYHCRLVVSNLLGTVYGGDQLVWYPIVMLNGPARQTNECHSSVFTDLGATAKCMPRAIDTGYDYTLILRADGSTRAVGENAFGEVTGAAGITGVAAIAAGPYHGIALKTDGTLVGWGRNEYGIAEPPTGLTNVLAVAAGLNHNLALRANGTVTGWGLNTSGEITPPPEATNIVQIAAGQEHSLALRADGIVLAWGGDSGGATNVPAGLTDVVAIGAYGHSLALKSDRTVLGWGQNLHGQADTPPEATNVMVIAAGAAHSLALRADGTVIGWGNNYSGQATGIPNPVSPYGSTGIVMVAGQPLTNAVAIAGGLFHSVAILADGSIVGWGANDHGQINFPSSLYDLGLVVATNGTVNPDVPGSYVLTYSTTNASGAVASVTRTVIVRDTLRPVIDLFGDNPIVHRAGVAFVDPGFTATDLCDPSIVLATNIVVLTNTPGVYINTYTARDVSGNQATTNRSVRVVDLPFIATLAPTDISPGSVTARGQVNPRGLATEAWFEWGTTTAYGNTSFKGNPGDGFGTGSLSTGFLSLTPGATYHYRAVASNALGIVYGGDVSFIAGFQTVTTLADSGAGSLRQALADAGNGSTITLPASGTISLNGQVVIADSIHIVGPGTNNLVVRSAGWGRVFTVNAGVTSSISGITIRDGYDWGGGGVYNAGNLTLTDCYLVNNRGADGGEGSWGGGTGGSGASGGGIYNHSSGVLTLTRCTISGNYSGWGGIGGHGYTGADGWFWGDDGGPGGTGGNGGAGAGIYNAGVLSLNACTIQGNQNGGGGSGGTGGNGGWGSLDNGTGGRGGNGGYGGSGAGLYNAGSVVVVCSTIANNVASPGGSGGSPGSGEGNYGAGWPGSSGVAGGIYNAGAPVQIFNSIAARNIMPSNVQSDVQGTFVSQGHNLIGATDGSTGFTYGVLGDIAGTSGAAINPLLGAIAWNGGPTPTCALTSGSPAISAGDNSAPCATDQRGFMRVGIFDIGAFEAELPVISGLAAYVTGTNQIYGSCSALLQGTVHMKGIETRAFFKYGLTTAYSAISPVQVLPALNETRQPSFSLDGLLPGTSYHWTLSVSNAVGVVNGPDQVLTIPARVAPGDLNGDGIVDQTELDEVLAGYYPTSPWLYMTNMLGLGQEDVTFALSNSTAGAYGVEFSTNLVDWEYLGPATPRFGFTDTNAPAAVQRFYRLKWPLEE